MKLSKTLGALLVCALFCAPALADVTILDFGSDTANGGPNLAYTEIIEAGDVAPIAANGIAPDVSNPVSATFALTDGATLTWTDVTTWNNNIDAGANAGENYFAHQTALDGTNPTTFSITTANATDTVLVEAIAGFSRDALVGYGDDPAVVVDQYVLGTSSWSLVGTSVGSSTGTLAANAAGTTVDEGNIGAFRITITTAVPEPSSLGLLGLAGFASLVVRRRK